MFNKEQIKERTVWKNLWLALVCAPFLAGFGLVIITIIGALDDKITEIQYAGHWWIILVVSYILSLICLFYAPYFCKNREREKMVNALILYWDDQHTKRGQTLSIKPRAQRAGIRGVSKKSESMGMA